MFINSIKEFSRNIRRMLRERFILKFLPLSSPSQATTRTNDSWDIINAAKLVSSKFSTHKTLRK